MNAVLILILLIAASILLFFIIRRGEGVSDDIVKDTLSIPYLVQGVRSTFEEVLNKNISELNLNKTETRKREKNKSLLRKNLRSCNHGDIGAKEYVKDYIKEILQSRYYVNDKNINEIIPFHKTGRLSMQDKFEIILYIYKKQFEYDALTELIKTYRLAEIRSDHENEEETECYEITRDQMEAIYEMESIQLNFTDKLEILSQRVYGLYKGFGVIDDIRDMKIDGVSGGISGIPFDFYTYHSESFETLKQKNFNAYDSVWIFFQGKTIHLSFLGFGSQNELIRVCKNIYRYGNPGQLSEAKGYIANDMKDGSRVVAFRPPFSDRWAFFVRKHDSILDMDITKIIKGDGSETLIQLLKWMVRGCLVIVITGEMGSGKTTLLKLLIQFIRRIYTIRVHEQIFELNLSRVYQDWNILTLRETETIPGQEALDIIKKTDGTVIILGEVASHVPANWLVETSQISKMTMCSHHAQTTEDLIDNLKIAQLRAGGFQNESLAEQQVVKAVHIDIHMENRNGHRYISRITEIVPVMEKEYPEDYILAAIEYFKRSTNRKSYEAVDILRYEGGKYVIKKSLSVRSRERIMKNLKEEEKGEFIKLFQDLRGECIDV